MSRSTWILGLLLLPLVAIQGWGIARFAAAPDFAVGIVKPLHSRLDVEQLSMTRRVRGGVLEIRARRARPGHETIGLFKWGPSTFLSLREVEVQLRAAGGVVWTAGAGSAELRDEAIELYDSPLLTRERGRAEAFRQLRIDLRTGAWSVPRPRRRGFGHTGRR